MGRIYDGIDERLAGWIARQPLFFVGTAPSGAETIAHLRDNGRIVVMLCAFEGPPRIVRLHGRGDVVYPSDERFAGLLDGFQRPAHTEAERAIIVVEVTRVADSCGYGVPLMSYEGERPHSDLSTGKRLRAKGPDALTAYQAEHNRRSIDGLPAVELDAGSGHRA